MRRRQLTVLGFAGAVAAGAAVGALGFQPGVSGADDPEPAVEIAVDLAGHPLAGLRLGPGHHGLIGRAADVIGIEREELVDELAGGRSIADVAREHGVDPADVIAALTADAEEHISALVNGDLPFLAARRGPTRLGNRLLGAVADAIGIEREVLEEALDDGRSIAEVAEEHGVDPDTVVAALVARGEERIDEALEAGRIDDERAERMRDRLESRVSALVEGEHMLRLRRGGDFAPLHRRSHMHDETSS